MTKKILLAALAASAFVFVPSVSAQVMMGQLQSPTPEGSTSSTSQDEANGKLVWDKLQSKQVTCTDLKDDDFDVLGDYAMGQMVGSSHAAMNSNMTTMMGGDGEKQMHIAIGKQYTGCNTTTAAVVQTQQPRGWSMMGDNGAYSQQFMGLHVIGFLTWILGVIFLASGTAYFWKEIKRKEK